MRTLAQNSLAHAIQHLQRIEQVISQHPEHDTNLLGVQLSNVDRSVQAIEQSMRLAAGDPINGDTRMPSFWQQEASACAG